MNAISVKNLSFSYSEEEKTVDNVSFDVPQGAYVSIVGHNGSGKSTLAKLIIGLLEQSDGEIYIFDELATHKNIRNLRQKISLVFQNPDNQFIGATVEDDIAFGLENRRVPHEQMNGIVLSYAKKVGMDAYLDKEPSRLSGGQKQRVAIAGALALNPEIIIFDESTSMLDPKGKSEIRELIELMRKDNPNLTILSITHDIEEAYLSDEIIVMGKGKILMQGKPEELFDKKEELTKLNLQLPFVLDLKNQLKDININANDAKTVDEIVEAICQSK